MTCISFIRSRRQTFTLLKIMAFTAVIVILTSLAIGGVRYFEISGIIQKMQ